MCVLLSLFWPTFQSLIYELVDEDGCSSSFDISTRITQCAGFSSIRMYDDHDEVSHWVKSEESEDCKHVFFWFFLARRSWYILKVSEPVSCILGTGKKYRYRYRQNLVPEKSIGIGIVKIWYRKKVSVSVSKISGTGKKYRYRYRSKLWVPSHSVSHNTLYQNSECQYFSRILERFCKEIELHNSWSVDIWAKIHFLHSILRCIADVCV